MRRVKTVRDALEEGRPKLTTMQAVLELGLYLGIPLLGLAIGLLIGEGGY
jgi:hypothetical protein